MAELIDNEDEVKGIARLPYQVGYILSNASDGTGYSVLLLVQAIVAIRLLPRKLKETAHQMYLGGIQSTPLLIIVTMFTGMVISFALGETLRRYNQQDQVAFAVTFTMFTQFGPIWAAIVLASRVGASISAELGTMKVSEEIDALEVMSIDPIYYLVMPRLVAMAVMCPLLTILGNVMGSLGGAMIAHFQLGVDYTTYYNIAKESIDFFDLMTGMLKAFIFGILIITIACSQGLRAKNGASGVGQATRSSVVISLLMVVMFNYFLTVLMQFFKPGIVF